MDIDKLMEAFVACHTIFEEYAAKCVLEDGYENFKCKDIVIKLSKQFEMPIREVIEHLLIRALIDIASRYETEE